MNSYNNHYIHKNYLILVGIKDKNQEQYNEEIIKSFRNKDIENKYQEIKWKGTSDTETLINLFEIYEFEDVINKLEGMFAFSLFDKKNNFLYLVRDLAGEKPLYVSTSDHSLLFSSEMMKYIHPTNVSSFLCCFITF